MGYEVHPRSANLQRVEAARRALLRLLDRKAILSVERFLRRPSRRRGGQSFDAHLLKTDAGDIGKRARLSVSVIGFG